MLLIFSYRLSSAYQMYLAKNKPQHKRLSIMQAQEIFQHERKFTAKYGRSSTPGSQNGPEVSVEESEQHVPRSRGEASQRDESNCREKCGSKLPQRSKQSPPSVKPGYTGGVVIHTEHRELSLATAKYNAAKEKREPSRSQAKQVFISKNLHVIDFSINSTSEYHSTLAKSRGIEVEYHFLLDLIGQKSYFSSIFTF